MTFEDYLLELFYLVDSELAAMNRPRLRARGPRPMLHDSEVITMELVGEFLGIDTDKGIGAYFRRCHRAEFPGIARIDRTRFARQAADLWRVKQRLHRRLLALPPCDDPASGERGPLSLIDSFPLRVCRSKRAPGHKLFRGLGAAFGRDPTGGRLFFGFRVHPRCTDRGFCAAAELAPGNVADWPMAAELLPEQGRVGIGDRNYWDPDGRPQLLAQGFDLQAPFRKASADPMPGRSALLSRLRQVIEPVIGQLATRFHGQRTWARATCGT